jgi:polysaccharide deacetylase family protein (PEP-CTERM system associated)
VRPITFTLDIEDHRPDADAPLRFPELTRSLLDLLDSIGARGTVFVVGEVADACRDLVTEIAARGHEIALHDWSHRQLDRTDPERFRADTQRGKDLLEDLVQAPVLGYRAATFSLMPSTVWATEILAELGFAYSSSVLPAKNPLHGFPGAPTGPFTWPCGLLELPVPLIDMGATRVPLGGTYLRLLPMAVIRRRVQPVEVPFLYCHPYDFDTDEPFWWEPVAGRLAPLLWVGRKGLRDKVHVLLRHPGAPLGERLAEARAVATPFDPSAGPLVAATPAGGRATGDQREMVHRLPQARCVDRIAHLTAAAEGRSVIHVGFVDRGYRDMQEQAGTWLHAHLAGSARSLVGLDLDVDGVEAARAAGYDAHAIDCRDTAAVRAAGLQPAEVVIAGEVIEHLDEPGPFLDALHGLVAPGGRLILTTPNASGLLNTVAALVGREVNHPDHVVLFSWRTLQTLLRRHGWEVEDSATYVPVMKAGARAGGGALALGARAVLGAERLAGRLGAGFVADGLIVSCRALR